MNHREQPSPLNWDPAISPASLFAGWPADAPLAALVSHPPPHDPAGRGHAHGESASPWARWSYFAAPDRLIHIPPGRPDALEQIRTHLRLAPTEAQAIRTTEVGGRRDAALDSAAPPFQAGWIMSLAYELGRDAEPHARHTPSPRALSGPTPWPAAALLRCDAVLAHDHAEGRWWITGCRHERARLLGLAGRALANSPDPHSGRFHLGHLRSLTGQAAFESAVATVVELIHAGDIFQANIAHHLAGPFEGSSRGLFAAMTERSRPWFGAYLELAPVLDNTPARAICSFSPELFLAIDPVSGQAVARPMKGTRPLRDPTAHSDLSHSAKDRAELNMIVDLMRNDLGRIARPGQVFVDDPRALEPHGDADLGVLQGVATIRAALRDGLSFADLLRAAFPPGSVTGAPKIRAMQIIEQVEPLPRGPYCGCLGYADDRGHSMLSVAIRTAMIQAPPAAQTAARSATARPLFHRGSTITFPVGAGIVAQSDPRSEWEETLHKARAILALADSASPAEHAHA